MLLKSKLEKVKKLLKTDNVLAHLEERYCYSTDAGNRLAEGKIPDLVVFVESIEEVQAVLKYANKYKIPVVSRGAGTNMVGACICVEGGIVLNFSKMNKILEINEKNMTATVQPGVVLAKLKETVEESGLFFPPDPSNYRVSTIGGAIAQSSAGALAFKYGSTKDYVLSLKVVTADGKILDLGAKTSKDAVGYHLNQLIVGSEGTLAIVVEATLKLLPKPESTATVAAYFKDYKSAINAVMALKNSKIFPAAIDFMDKNSIITVENFMQIGLDISAECMLMVELDGAKEILPNLLNNVEKIISKYNAKDIVKSLQTGSENKYWQARQSSYAATTRLAPDVLSDDIIVPVENLLEMLEYASALVKEASLNMCLVGHIGDGNLHPQFAINLDNDEEFKKYIKIKSLIYEKAINLNGTISAEHGIGLEKMSYIENIIDKNVLEYMKLIKKIFDPNNILNPGKIFKL